MAAVVGGLNSIRSVVPLSERVENSLLRDEVGFVGLSGQVIVFETVAPNCFEDAGSKGNGKRVAFLR
jgi:hypothetical protein